MKHQQAVQDTLSKEENNSMEFRIAKNGIFFTLQGEGQNSGYPTLFIRLHGSNINYGREELRHTWDKLHPDYDSFISIDKRDLLKIALKHIKVSTQSNTIRNICFTGGGAMLQQKSIISFVENNLNYKYEIETNGLIYPNDELNKLFKQCIEYWLTLSPRMHLDINSKKQIHER